MKQMLPLLFLLFTFCTVIAQSNQWVWKSGDSVANQTGVYGTKGITSPANKPGARVGAARWTDAVGNLWLLGGGGYSANNSLSFLNDLWKYVPASGQWTWVSGDSVVDQTGIYGTKGVAASGNKPGARYGAINWTDAAGSLWLFGGSANTDSSSDQFNDLWKYAPSTGEWTWVSGDSVVNQLGVYGTKGNAAAGNKPGAREFATRWTDASGNLWLFGGQGYSNNQSPGDYFGFLNDLWNYSPSINQWTWVSGDTLADPPGIFGTKGSAAPVNRPRGRESAVGWLDASGNLWLFGGTLYPVHDSTELNDLWKYTPSTRQWTWASGDSLLAQKGVYGTRGTAALDNKPGARSNAVSWTDASGNLWLFGGGGFVDDLYQTLYYGGYQDDLWKYEPSTGSWTWISGDSTANQKGVYGIKGTAGPANKPGARAFSASWVNPSGNLWLFGGGYSYLDSIADYFNDLWQYTLSGSALPVQFTSFTAQKQKQQVLLNWTTAQEHNSHYFIVERSSGDVIFESIGQVAAMVTASYATSYSFIDKTPLAGDNFYRIRQVDPDGKSLYSGIVKIVMKEDATRFAVVQNPLLSTLQLSVQLPAAQKLVWQVRDINGRLLIMQEHRGHQGSSVYSVAVDHLSKGTYFVTLQTGNFSSTKTFIKQ